jgi:hypothetical protein
MPQSKGTRGVTLVTVAGEQRLARRYFWSKDKGGQCTADALLGICAWRSALSPGVREVCCILGLCQSFASAAGQLRRIAGVHLGKETLRQAVEQEAQQVQSQREACQVPAKLCAKDMKRVYVGVDGVLVPTVTAAEKRKRRKKQIRRRRRGGKAQVNSTKPLPPMRSGTDQRYKEVRVGIFYDQKKKHQHAWASFDSVQQVGELLRRQASLVQLDKARQKLSVTDAAAWIVRQLESQLPMLDAMLLDYYHLAQRVHQAAEVCLGQGEQARQWAKERLEQIKARGPSPLLEEIRALRKKVRSVGKRESLRQLGGYVSEHQQMLDYPRALAKGWDIGSGPTEAMCKTLCLRIKGQGMKWDLPHAAAIMNLKAMYVSEQAETYWKRRATATEPP